MNGTTVKPGSTGNYDFDFTWNIPIGDLRYDF